MFNPHASLEVHCPFRRLAWSLSTPVFDYRSAQHSGALDSANGEWYSRRAENIFGDLDVEYPLLKTAPGSIDARIRLSWWPPHVTVTWLGMDVYQKVSFRPATGAPCDWKEVPFRAALFTDAIRATYHRYFDLTSTVTAPPCPPRAEPNLATPSNAQPATEVPPSSTKPATEVPSSSNPPPVTEAPPSSPSVTASQWSQNDWESDDWHGWSSDWHASSYNDWQPNTWWSRGGHWEPSDDEDEKSVTAWEPNQPLDEPPAPESKPVNEAPPTNDGPTDVQTPVTDSPVTITAFEEAEPVSATQEMVEHSTLEESTSETRQDLETSVNSPPREYTVLEARQTIHTRSIRSTAGKGIDVPDEFAKMLTLQQLAMRGAPLSREDRVARQVIANQLHLSPQMYNYLVFGESDTADAEPGAITDAQPNSSSP